MDQKKTPLVYIFAGEVSGDFHGAELIDAITALSPEVEITGVAGPLMRSKGITSAIPMEKFQVMGFIDVFFALPRLVSLFKQVRDEILSLDPDIVIFIDYPGMNLRMAKALKKRGHTGKRVHYICPSVWAWGKKRIPKMAKVLDLLVTIFPFEKKFFQQTTLPVHYAGNPLLKKTRKTEGGRKLAIFPGSRKQEIKKNLPLQIALAKTTGLPIVISCANKNFRDLLESFGFPVLDGLEALEEADIAIATSGTITLELALAQVPTLVTYAIRKFDEFLARYIFRINLSFYALPNIIAEEEIFPEHFGSNFTFEKAKKSLDSLLSTQDTTRLRCKKVLEKLGSAPNDEKLARPILNLLEN